MRMAQCSQIGVTMTIVFLHLLGESPLMLTDLTVGTHWLKIIPEGCQRQFRSLSFKFTIN